MAVIGKAVELKKFAIVLIGKKEQEKENEN
jgi:hypothetical protein